MMICSSCGRESPRGALFCLHCGARLGTEATASGETPGQAVGLPGAPSGASAPPVRCPRCVAENPAGMNFCRNCGGSLAPIISTSALPAASVLPATLASQPNAQSDAQTDARIDARIDAHTGAQAEPAPAAVEDGPSQPVASTLRMPRRSCPHCSAKTPAGFSFCQHCGKPLPSVSEAVRTGAVISGETGGSSDDDDNDHDDEPDAPPPAASPGQDPGHPASAESAAGVTGLARPASQPRAASRPGRPARVIPAMGGGLGEARADRAEATHAAAAPGPVWGTLIVLEPDGTEGRRYPLSGEWIEVGRTQGDIRFENDRFLAHSHARIERDGSRVRMVPIDTLNGVYRRLREPVALDHGAMLLMGREVLRFERLEEDERAAPALVRHGVALFGSPPRKPWGRLVQVLPSGGVQDVRHLWAPSFSVGREEGDMVFPDDVFLSRRHAILSWREGRCVAEDAGSVNGTFLRLPGRAELHPGDHVRMGDQLFRFVIDARP